MKQTDMIKIIIVDDHPIVTEGVKALLKNHPDLTVLQTFDHGLPSLPYLEVNEVDVVLLDISLPDTNGMELCLKIKSINSKICVIVLSNHAERSLILSMLQNGASGYILKTSPVDEIKQCITDALNGGLAFTKAVQQIILKPTVGELKKQPKITKREKQILQLIADGKTTSNIAETLFLSPATVETHRHNMMQKFGVKNAIELLKVVQERMLI
ncbi:DNA-binding NarL/FixJ family response regulator [Pedobacter cryoconitis]|uniref:DNA-binding NarL/FixJ family response regulator n=1 Tax=Pedobacter cryoconitis TaxID=188932 RepID=A0A7W9DM44_9SPHI|nr:response regulator transcription factor [Pedobacter cryoconitis]MBB5622825.1 DNA-binding NarL/FixJ family response regulator [Pedobacter cryoconitis]